MFSSTLAKRQVQRERMIGDLAKSILAVKRCRALVQRIYQQGMDAKFASQLQAALYGVLQQRFAQTVTLLLRCHSKTCQPSHGHGIAWQSSLIRC